MKLDTNLICYATRCIYNNSDYCYANKISIDGRLADPIVPHLKKKIINNLLVPYVEITT